MTRKLIAFVTAGAIATAGLSAPAKADPGQDIARLLIGAAIVGAIINSANNGDARVTVTHGNSRPGAGRPHAHRPPVVHHRPTPPRQCLVRERTRHGWTERYAPRCMARFGWKWERGGWVPTRHARR
jgi:hypothetical protein